MPRPEEPTKQPKTRTEADVSVSRTVAANIKRFRLARGLSGRALASRIQANGHRMGHASLTRIEIGRHPQGSLRVVTVDELVWFAEALGVAPTLLLGASECPTCKDCPPPGFICGACGSGADRE